MKHRHESEEVLYPAEPVVRVDAEFVGMLKAESDKNPRKRIRLCAHPDVEARIHEMLIVHTRDTYVRPHKHIGKSESFHVVEGEADVVLLDESGGVTDVVSLGSYGSGRNFYYRLSGPLYHTLLISSDHIVFHECTGGPFKREETVFPDWAPDGADMDAANEYMAQLRSRVRSRA